jgi:hypothetical protein
MYSGALTDAEVLQNFNEMNTRYSLSVPSVSTALVTRTAAHTLSLASEEPSSTALVTRTAVYLLMRDARTKSWAYILT